MLDELIPSRNTSIYSWRAKKLIWIDVTEIKNWQGNYTGIQRVISKIGLELSTDKEKFHTCYFDYSTATFREVDYIFKSESTSASGTNSSFMGRARGKFARKVKALNARLPETLKGGMRHIIRVGSIGGVKGVAVNFSSDDTLFIPGAFWIYPVDRLLSLKKSHNVKIVGVLYDLVPIVVPQFTARVTVDGFGARFGSAMETFDQWFAISENTKLDAIAEAKRRDIKYGAIHVIKLGVDIVAETTVARAPHDFKLKPNRFSIFVSTIEARKNQALIYQAVKRLREKRVPHYPIVLVGKHGWLSDDFVYILKNDISIQDDIIWLDNVSDGELQWLYTNCRFTIYPSFYEGWGLPVAESLAMGKPCIASNTSSLPEAGGEYTEYFSPYSADELAELIAAYNDDNYLHNTSKRLTHYTPQTWKQCAQNVRGVLLAQD